MNSPTKSDRELAEELRQVTTQAGSIESVLRTNDRVIARVTDGIYRQPGSAIRELIANAYDADATWVSVKTDAPKFSRITIEDDGTGMTPDAVIHLLHNIGGSAKRTEQGQALGIASEGDPTLTPGGRKLIGKLGIGIFSVSQLTHSFQIITKTAGDAYRTVVLVRLKQFADEPSNGDETDFKAGEYQVWRERTSDVDAHGTTIVLTSIRPQTRDSLRSEQLWSSIDNPISEESGAKSLSAIPLFHIGRLDGADFHIEDKRGGARKLPWEDRDDPDVAFSKMVDCVWSSVQNRATVKLAEIFDNYLQMVWNLALSLPLPYVNGSVLDEQVSDDWAYFFKLSNSPKGSATQLISSEDGVTLREISGLSSTSLDESDEFRVVIDGLQLSRPLKYRGLPTTQHALKKPMVFVGSLREDFNGFDRDVSAGPLEFEAYLFWTPKVAPTEHQGVLVRIHGASGTLFDSTFLNYQIAELTRLRQITCEVFVKQGLEAALNIDRESFNTAHPHTVLLTRWVHSALRQLATAQKRQAQEVRLQARDTTRRDAEDRVAEIIEAANAIRSDGEGVVPHIRFTGSEELSIDPEGITQTYELARIVGEIPSSAQIVPRSESLRRLESITKLLAVYGVLEQLSQKEQENLLGSILGILEAENIV
ncbi:ATP-binding protein [Microbacterium sp. 22179]|uniref:ATP-binding protein n=1 Tax=Microbacterium sp. 22179 TaxID=3453886 RepID=UPI003F8333A4